MNTLPLRLNRSTLSLIITNLITILVAVYESWSLTYVVWIYWFQSLIIGYFHYQRIQKLKNFSFEGELFDDPYLKESKYSQPIIAIFFLIHYGFFHLFYLTALDFKQPPWSSTNFFPTLLCLIPFVLNHFFSFRSHLQEDLKHKPSLSKLYLLPYARILPMHFFVMFGALLYHLLPLGNTVVLIIFLSLKTIADVSMHTLEHQKLAASKNEP